MTLLPKPRTEYEKRPGSWWLRRPLFPGATLLDDFITPAKLSVGFELLRKMGWKEGQGVGPRVKRRPRRQKPDPGVKIYGCALPPGGSEGSEDEDDDYLPDNVTFAPKDVTPVDFTPKDNVHGLAYQGLDPHQALFGTSREHFNLFWWSRPWCRQSS
uniref:G patch domain-containing protein 1-like isoform X1 n=1 Tax=Castor canadensis TaxID=51338 RepID=A0A8B7W132_CASCN|nr:G patch domain-containing protein 1-like isoform X1 [Castor canadensis]